MTYIPNSSSSGVEVGTIREFAIAVPSGWLNCDGTVVSQAAYPALYSAIGGVFNIGGEGVGNFRLPDKRRRVSVGAGGVGTPILGNSLGNVGGDEVHTLSTAEMPSHTHTYYDGDKTGDGGSWGLELGNDVESFGSTRTSDSTGGGTAHNNIQPSIVLCYGIKY